MARAPPSFSSSCRRSASPAFHDPGRNRPHIVGINFGIVTDIQTAPDGNLLVVALDKGTVYEVSRSRSAQ